MFEVQRINDTRHIHKKIVDNHEPEKKESDKLYPNVFHIRIRLS